MARWLQNAPADVKRPERPFTVDPLTDLLVFHGAAAGGAVTAEQVTDNWIAAAKRSSRAPVGRFCSPRSGTPWASAPAAAQAGPAAAASRTVLLAGRNPSRSAGCAGWFSDAAHRLHPLRHAAAAKVRHFETYNRTAAAQQVADIVAALRASPASVLSAAAAPHYPALLAAAIVPVRRVVVDADGFDTSSDAQFLNRIDIPGLRRAGDFQTAAGMAHSR